MPAKSIHHLNNVVSTSDNSVTYRSLPAICASRDSACVTSFPIMKIPLTPAFVAVVLASITVDASPIPSQMGANLVPRHASSSSSDVSLLFVRDSEFYNSILQDDYRDDGLLKRNDEPKEAKVEATTDVLAGYLVWQDPDRKKALARFRTQALESRTKLQTAAGDVQTTQGLEKELFDAELNILLTIVEEARAAVDRVVNDTQLLILMNTLKSMKESISSMLKKLVLYDQNTGKQVPVDLFPVPEHQRWDVVCEKVDGSIRKLQTSINALGPSTPPRTRSQRLKGVGN
ncbi:hypothetical protein H0H93_006707 [Arthromyces matolae]|nr:hypothetical protein H0H93_006707 [Arthromyces matolae]